MAMNTDSVPTTFLSWQQQQHNESNKDSDEDSELYNDSDGLEDCEVVAAAEPCLYLSTADMVYQVTDVNTIDVDGEKGSANIPSAVASPLHLPDEVCPVFDPLGVPTATPKTTTSSRSSKTQQQSAGVRPEFIFASALLEGISIDEIGITLERRPKGGVHVAGISPDSPFLGSNIQPGDHVIAVNHLLCANYNVDQVQELIKASTTKVSICVHNPRGEARLVSSSIMKPQPNTKVGITLRRRNDIIRIKDITDQSLFRDTLMTTRQRCRSINGWPCEHLTAHTASALIGHANSRVTIVTELKESSAVAIGVQESTGGWWHRVAVAVVGLAGMGKQGAVCTVSPLES